MSFIAVAHNNHLTLNGINYFRGGAESITMGCYGEKKTPVFGQNCLEVQAEIPAPKLTVREVTECTIDFTRSTAADVKLKLKVAGGYSGSVDTAYNDLKSGKLKLLKFEMLLGDVKTAVHSAPQVLDNLRSYGNDARVAHQIFVVLEATLSRTFSTATTVTFTKDSGTLTAKANTTVTTGGTTTVTLSQGTTYAYLLCKADGDRGKDRVEIFHDDQWSTS